MWNWVTGWKDNEDVMGDVVAHVLIKGLSGLICIYLFTSAEQERFPG